MRRTNKIFLLVTILGLCLTASKPSMADELNRGDDDIEKQSDTDAFYDMATDAVLDVLKERGCEQGPIKYNRFMYDADKDKFYRPNIDMTIDCPQFNNAEIQAAHKDAVSRGIVSKIQNRDEMRVYVQKGGLFKRRRVFVMMYNKDELVERFEIPRFKLFPEEK